jgi:ribosome-associated toxin RatA of RatAB toxin-antitoxin module
VYDVQNIGLENFDPVIGNHYLELGMNYPQRFSKTIMWRPNGAFLSIFEMIKKFLDQQAIEKITVVKTFEDLQQYIDEQYIPVSYGGKAVLDTSVETFFKKYNSRTLIPPLMMTGSDSVEEEGKQQQQTSSTSSTTSTETQQQQQSTTTSLSTGKSAFSHSVIVHATVAECLQVVTDFHSYPSFLSQMESVKIMQRAQDGSSVDVAYIVSTGFFQFHYDLHHQIDQKNGTMAWSLLEGTKTLKSNSGFWQFKKLDEASTLAHYEVSQMEFRIWLPESVIQMFVGNSLMKNIEKGFRVKMEELHVAAQKTVTH